jgi:hypothetical protein
LWDLPVVAFLGALTDFFPGVFAILLSFLFETAELLSMNEIVKQTLQTRRGVS